MTSPTAHAVYCEECGAFECVHCHDVNAPAAREIDLHARTCPDRPEEDARMNTPASPDVLYRGAHTGPSGAGAVEVVDQDGTATGLLRHIVRHSPTGFSWGYGGSGPADLARSLLIAALGDAAVCPTCAGTHVLTWSIDAIDWVPFDPDEHGGQETSSCPECDDGYRPLPYQRFKADFVCSWPDEWSITRSEILTWVAEHHPEVLRPGGVS